MTSIESHRALTKRQFLLSTIMGVILWLTAAILLRILGPMGAYDGFGQIATYALIIPGTVPFILLFKYVAGLNTDQLYLGYAIGTAAAMLCDGLALAWLPGLYGDTRISIAGAGMTILWGAGVGICLAYLMTKSQSQT